MSLATQNLTDYFVHSNASNATVSRRHFNTNQFYIFLAFSVLLSVIVVAGNALVLVSYKINVRLQTRTNRFLASLAVSDLLVGAVSIPLWIYTTSARTSHSTVLYNIFMCLDIISALASILHLTGICVERYVAISKPLRHRTVNPGVFNLMIAAAWFIAVLVAILYPFQKKYNFPEAYVVVVFILGYAGPLLTISLMHTAIYRISRRVLRSKSLRDQAQRMMRSKTQQRIQRETRTLLTVTLVTCLFFIAWSPFFIMLLLSMFFPNTLPSYPFLFQLVLFAKWMHYGNSAINPFVYAFRNIEMRKTFLYVLKTFCCWKNREQFHNCTVQNMHRIESRVFGGKSNYTGRW